MPIRIIKAVSSSEKDQVYQLRHKVFVEEEARFDTQEKRVFDRFDSFHDSESILAFEKDIPIATLRISYDSPVGLPSFDHYDFSSYIKSLEGKCACVGWLGSLKGYRHHPGLVIGMFKTATRKIRINKNRHIISTIHPPILPLLEKVVGAKAVGDQFFSGHLKVPMIPIHIDLDNLKPGTRETFEDPIAPIIQNSDERRIYKNEEVIIKAGEKGRHAFLVMRGSARVVTGWSTESQALDENHNHLLFGRGQIFGELSLIDGKRRTTTVVCHSNELDLMVLNQKIFYNELVSNPDTANQILKIVTARLRRNIENKPMTSNSELLARIMLDASNSGEKSVNQKWLARQCGIWMNDMNQITEKWINNRWIDIQDENFRILAPNELECLTNL